VYSCYSDCDENITTGLTATTKKLTELLSRIKCEINYTAHMFLGCKG